MSARKTNNSDSSFRLSDQRENRRSFLKKTCLAAASVAGSDVFVLNSAEATINQSDSNKVPWYRRVTRWGQTNITEKDPVSYDIPWWRSYWKRTEIQGVIINAGGIVAYYPSRIPLHRQAEYLGGKDLLGSLCGAAHEDGLAVFARMDSNRAHEEFYNAHPDWFAIDSSGRPYKAGDLFITCINSPYYNNHIPDVMREIIRYYHPEGFTDNSWSGLGRDSICYCENCKKSFLEASGGLEIPLKPDWNDNTYRMWIRWNYARRIEIWELNNRTTREAGGNECIWAGMNSGSVSGQSRSFRDYREICKRADIIMLDSQSRNDAEGFQQNAFTGKLIHGLLGWDKLIPESMAMYQAGRPTFRLSAKPAAEARMWMKEGIAGGIQPWWHHVGAYHEDRRMYNTAGPVLKWHKANEEYLINRKPVASIGVVWSQQNTDFYGRDSSEQLVDLPTRGMTQALLKARIPYLPVHADQIAEIKGHLAVLILPNLGLMTGQQIAGIRKFVQAGGSLVASGESSLYDEWGDPLSDFALADLFGVHIKESVQIREERLRRGPDALHTYLRLAPGLRSQVEGPKNGTEPPVTGTRHPVLAGFEETDILPFGGILRPLETESGAEVIMTFIPEFPIYPPETAWMRVPSTEIPGLVLRELPGGGRIAFMPADLDRQYGRYNLPDHGNLLANIIRWASKDKIPLTIEGKGLMDCHLYSQPGRMILHIVNLTNTAAWRQPVDELIPVGPLNVNVRLAEEVAGQKVKLLVSQQNLQAVVNGGWCRFEVNRVTDHEVAVIS